MSEELKQHKAVLLVHAEDWDPKDSHLVINGVSWVIDVSRRAKSENHAIEILKDTVNDAMLIYLVESGQMMLATQTITDDVVETNPVNLRVREFHSEVMS